MRPATNACDGIDYCSSNNSTTCAVQSISVPTMIFSMGGYDFIRDVEIIFMKSASKDKDFIIIEGALHGFQPCTACETTKGQYSNTVKNLFDSIRDWDQQAILAGKIPPASFPRSEGNRTQPKNLVK